MIDKNDSNKRLNTRKVNELVKTGNKILNILYILFIILLVYVVSLIFKEWKILGFLGKILSIISPIFIGWFFAWLLNPIVKKLTDKGMNRLFATIIAYLAMVLMIGLILAFTIPSLGTQISDIVTAVPSIVSDIKEWINNIFVKISNLSLENLDSVKNTFMGRIETIATDIETSLPEMAMNFVSSLASGLGKILLSLILGFYLLFDFDKVTAGFISLFPEKSRGEISYLLEKLNDSLYSFISGTLWLSLLLFVVSIIGFSIIGLNAPVLIAFICVITNLIPYMGAAVAGAIGFAESSTIGVLTLLFILVVQTIDGNVLQPLVMSKKMNLSPITIILSLLIFEYLFGIFGMIIATPAVALLKIIFVFIDEKYNLFGFKDKEEE